MKQEWQNYEDVTSAFQPPKTGSLPSVLLLQSSSLIALRKAQPKASQTKAPQPPQDTPKVVSQ